MPGLIRGRELTAATPKPGASLVLRLPFVMLPKKTWITRQILFQVNE